MSAVSRDVLDDLRAKAVQARDEQCGWPRESPDVVLSLLDHVDALEATIARVHGEYDRLLDRTLGPNGDEHVALVNSGRREVLRAFDSVLSEGADDGE